MLNVDCDALARVCARYHVTELSLFGSAARGTQRPGSDVDLLVVCEEAAVVTLFTLVDLQTDLSELLGRRVDVVPKRRTISHSTSRIVRESDSWATAR